MCGRISQEERDKNMSTTADDQKAPEEHRLEVDRKEFLSAIKSIAKFKRKSKTGGLWLSLIDDELVMKMAHVTICVVAHGTWPGEVSMDSGIIWKLAAVPPNGDPITISIVGDRVKIGTTVVMATSTSTVVQ